MNRTEAEYLFGGRRVSFVDKTITCVDCGQPFTFTAGEQEFHQSKGFTTEPRRCPRCRTARKGGANHKREGETRDTFTVACASCGNPAKVPFEPREGRPVYCSDCFQPQPRGVASAFARKGTQYGAFRGGYSNSHSPRGGGQRDNRGGFDRSGGDFRRSPRGQRPRTQSRGW
jgi:CxxC-x17-CxxC domain-containing protein